MPTPVRKPAASHSSAKAATFNYNKLQAAVCMAASVVASIALVTWAIKSFL